MAKSVVLDIHAAPEDMWRVIGEQWGDVHRILPSLSGSRLLTPGVGEGSVRECTLAKPVMGLDSVVEELVLWDPPRRLAYRVRSPPWPMCRLENRWTVEPGGGGDEVCRDRQGDEARGTGQAGHATTRRTLEPSVQGRRGLGWLARFAVWKASRDLAGDAKEMVRAIECAAA